MNAQEESLLDFPEAQAYLNVSRATLLRWIKNGKVAAYKTGKKWKFFAHELDQLVLREPSAPYVTAGTPRQRRAPGRQAGGNTETQSHELLDAALEECAWVDREGWVMLSCTVSGGTAELCVHPAEPDAGIQCKRITAGEAVRRMRIWSVWQEDSRAEAPRPGIARLVRMAGGIERATLQLSIHAGRIGPLRTMLASAREVKLIHAALEAGERDWQVCGPPRRETAALAYALARLAAAHNHLPPNRVATVEREPSYHWPGAMQVVSPDVEPGMGDGAELLVIECAPGAPLPPRGLRSPRMRIGYAYGTEPPRDASAVCLCINGETLKAGVMRT